MIEVRRVIILPLVAGLLMSCSNDPVTPAPTAPAPTPTPAANDPGTPGAPATNDPAAKTPVAAAQSGEACKDYAAAICKEAGEQSATCTQFRASTELMPAAACTAGLADLSGAKEKIKALSASCDELITKLCTAIGEETDTCALVRSKTGSFPPDRCKEMLGPEVFPQVVAELKQQEEQNKPLDPAKQALIAASSASEFGPADAKVVVVEFSDFECPYCSRVLPVTKALKEKYAGKVRFVFRHFPLDFHKDAHLASQASLAAADQGKFWEFHDKLFANQKAISRPDLEKYATELGLDGAKFKKALDKSTHAQTVDADIALGKTVGVAGTPSMFVNGARVANPSDVGLVTAAIDRALAAAP